MYDEQRHVWWAWLIAVAAVLGSVGYAAALIHVAGRGGPVPGGAVVAFGAAGVGLLVLWLVSLVFGRYSVRLDRGSLTFGFALWSVTLPVPDIAAASRFTGSLLRFGGLGWRLGPRGQIGYLASFGPAVTVTTRWGRTYVFSCRDPDRLLKELASSGVPRDQASE